MTLNGLFKHTCTIKSLQSTTNRLGENSKGHETTGTTGIPCFLQVETVKRVSDEDAELLAVDGYELFLKPAVSISIGDKVEDILDADGNTVVSGTFYVQTVAMHGTPRRNHHQTAVLKQ